MSHDLRNFYDSFEAYEMASMIIVAELCSKRCPSTLELILQLECLNKNLHVQIQYVERFTLQPIFENGWRPAQLLFCQIHTWCNF